MIDKKVKVFRPGEGSTKTAQTVGMEREELVSTPNAWVGMVQTEAGFTSGWHHHGDYDTYVYVIAGEVAFIPKDTVHRESNPSTEKQFLFGVRVGQGAPVFNVDGPVGR
jgi:quercetin dioxygenase-like cupin family protein